jgi:hypothetical protein
VVGRMKKAITKFEIQPDDLGFVTQ